MEKEFLALIEQHKALIYKVCHVYAVNEDAKSDLFQEIIAQLWRAFPTYNKGMKWTTWAYRIALNVAITQRRKGKIETVSLSETLQIDVEKSLPDHVYDTGIDEQLEALHRAIGQLNPVEKALVLLYLEGVSYQEIAEITGVTINHVGVKVNRIKAKLKLLLTYGKA